MSHIAPQIGLPRTVVNWSPRFNAIVGIIAFLGCCLAIEWLETGILRSFLLCLVAGIVGIGIWHFDRIRRLEKSPRHRWVRPWGLATVFTLVTVTLCCAVAAISGTWRIGDGSNVWNYPAQHWFLIKLPTVIIQQIMLQMFVMPALQINIKEKKTAALVAASVFAILHFPNPMLMVLTWLGGWVWVLLYLRYQRLAPLVCSHFVLAVAVSIFGGEYVLNMRVGRDCATLLPFALDTDTGRLPVLPQAVSGEITSVIQTGSSLIARGIAADAITNRKSTTFCLVAKNGRRVVFARDTSKGDGQRFELQIPLISVADGDEWTLFSANRNGWFAPLGLIQEIIPSNRAPTEQVIQLYPLRVDGRCEQLISSDQGTRASGWAVDVVEPAATLRIAIVCDQKVSNVAVIQRVPRKDIVAAFAGKHVAKCGFEVLASGIQLPSARQIDFYAIDDRGVWHPLPMTLKAAERLAQTWPQIDWPKYR